MTGSQPGNGPSSGKRMTGGVDGFGGKGSGTIRTVLGYREGKLSGYWLF